jgi:hypothetical protein
MTKHPIDMLSVSVSRRQVMTGAAGLTFAVALSRGDPAAAGVPAGEMQGKSLSPWVGIAPNARSRSCRPQPRWGKDR